jgi:hemolysin activation/secretion protein
MRDKVVTKWKGESGKCKRNQACTPAIPATQEAEVGELRVWVIPGKGSKIQSQKQRKSQVWRLMPIIPATQEVEIGRILG